MERRFTYHQIKNQFTESNWNTNLISNSILDPNDRDKTINYIIEQLNSNETSIRYIASLMIIQYDINDAVETLINRILDPDTLDSNGTMTFALEELDCKNHLVDIYRILSSQSYESKCHAYNILSEQEFVFTKDDIIEMKRILDDAIQNRTANQIYDDETLEMVKDGYEGFEHYLVESERKYNPSR